MDVFDDLLADIEPGKESALSSVSDEKRRPGVDQLCSGILSLVSEGRYGAASTELDLYLDSKCYIPIYKYRTERYFRHSKEIIEAIKLKKEVLESKSLRASKSQEINDKIKKHYNDLKDILRKIEKIEHEIRYEDARSTVWVVKSFIFSMFLLLGFLIIREGLKSMGVPTEVLFQDISKYLEFLMTV